MKFFVRIFPRVSPNLSPITITVNVRYSLSHSVAADVVVAVVVVDFVIVVRSRCPVLHGSCLHSRVGVVIAWIGLVYLYSTIPIVKLLQYTIYNVPNAQAESDILKIAALEKVFPNLWSRALDYDTITINRAYKCCIWVKYPSLILLW